MIKADLYRKAAGVIGLTLTLFEYHQEIFYTDSAVFQL